MATVEAYLANDGNVAATAKQLFTHRHTIRYRLERVSELCGHDVSATEGREKLGLGLKAMRVLGIACRARARHWNRGPKAGGPARRRGVASGGWVIPREASNPRFLDQNRREGVLSGTSWLWHAPAASLRSLRCAQFSTRRSTSERGDGLRCDARQ